MRFRYSIICGLLFLLVLSVRPAHSCECVVDSPRKAFRKATAIFTGVVLEVRENENYDPEKELMAVYKIKLKVVKRWKGANASEITILSNNGPMGTCGGFSFHKGEEYLIYAYGKSRVAPTSCAISRPISDKYAPELMQQLDSAWFRFKARIW